MRLTIRWQRLVTEDGKTCDRCAGTQVELHKAVETLRQSLRPIGMDVICVEEALGSEDCGGDITWSNRIFIQGRLLEDWLGGRTGQSVCESCCEMLGEQVECRTVSVGGATYEVIPASLIVQAGLLAAAEMLQSIPSGSCCAGGEPLRDTPCCSGAA